MLDDSIDTDQACLGCQFDDGLDNANLLALKLACFGILVTLGGEGRAHPYDNSDFIDRGNP